MLPSEEGKLKLSIPQIARYSTVLKILTSMYDLLCDQILCMDGKCSDQLVGLMVKDIAMSVGGLSLIPWPVKSDAASPTAATFFRRFVALS